MSLSPLFKMIDYRPFMPFMTVRRTPPCDQITQLPTASHLLGIQDLRSRREEGIIATLAKTSLSQVSPTHKEDKMKGRTFLGILLALSWLAVSSDLRAADAALGSWKLNVSKSKYAPGPPPKSGSVKYEASDGGYKRSGETIEADGTKSAFEYTAKYDGKDYPVTGSPVFDAIALKHIDDNTAEATLKKAGKVVRNAKRVVSKNGKVMTITMMGTNDKGEKVHNVAVYDKQ
jgi:hypothetical protein